MFCYKCGKKIDDEAVAYPHCGSETKNLNKNKPINVINQNSNVNKIPRQYSGLLDFTMICCTGGLWIIWMIVRPKY